MESFSTVLRNISQVSDEDEQEIRTLGEAVQKAKHIIQDFQKRGEALQEEVNKAEQKLKDVDKSCGKKEIYLRINEALLQKFKDKYSILQMGIMEAQADYDEELCNSLKKSLAIPAIDINLSDCWSEIDTLRRENRELENHEIIIKSLKCRINVARQKRETLGEEFKGIQTEIFGCRKRLSTLCKDYLAIQDIKRARINHIKKQNYRKRITIQ
ncbi:DgyrCDS97 [Dimorphilus gyrociliatus]|uniref:DgyrCDS97 n=1 Tax=Dimorphilus gyrociliatus TaxID=2664684 RepID=A0A7I8V651_9ANNE|nr:DgyrCDS97 [Dimorphilus gyrociliatus]